MQPILSRALCTEYCSSNLYLCVSLTSDQHQLQYALRTSQYNAKWLCKAVFFYGHIHILNFMEKKPRLYYNLTVFLCGLYFEAAFSPVLEQKSGFVSRSAVRCNSVSGQVIYREHWSTQS